MNLPVPCVFLSQRREDIPHVPWVLWGRGELRRGSLDSFPSLPSVSGGQRPSEAQPHTSSLRRSLISI